MAGGSKQSSGFTMIELMVALVIAAVMLGYALPAFNDFTVQRRMAANVNALASAINYARNEATRLGGAVTLQTVDASDTDNEWGPGFCVNAGNPGDCDAPLRSFTMDGEVTADAVLNNQTILTFNSRGMLQASQPETVQICGVDADDDPGRVVNINAVGRASILDLVCYP